MAIDTRLKTIQTPDPIIPGRQVDPQLGALYTVQGHRTYQALRDLEANKTSLGAYLLQSLIVGHVLQWDGAKWMNTFPTLGGDVTGPSNANTAVKASGNFLIVGTGSSPGAGSQSEHFGAGSSSAGLTGTSFGNSAVANGTGSAAFGNSAAGSNAHDSAFGSGAQAALGDSTAVGNSALAIGGAGSLAVGAGMVTTAARQAVIGGISAGNAVNDVYLGGGVTATAPAALTLQTTGGNGANVAGAAFTLAGGKSTGSAKGGDLLFQTSPAGAAGSTLNALITIMQLTGDSKIGIFGVTPVVRPAAYTVTNPVSNRSFDTTTVTTQQLAQVVGTLIADMRAYGWLQ